MLAAAILTVMPELFRSFADYRMPVYALALIVVMIVRPQGLFGIQELWDTARWKRMLVRLGLGPKPPRAVALPDGEVPIKIRSTVESRPPVAKPRPADQTKPDDDEDAS